METAPGILDAGILSSQLCIFFLRFFLEFAIPWVDAGSKQWIAFVVSRCFSIPAPILGVIFGVAGTTSRVFANASPRFLFVVYWGWSSHLEMTEILMGI